MNRPLLAVVVVTAMLGLALMASLAPDTGPAVGASPVPVVPRPRPNLRQSPRPPGVANRAASDADPNDALPAEDLGDEDAAFDGPQPFRQPEPVPPLDRDQVFTAELRGLASAAVSRREAWQSCWDRFASPLPDRGYDGRLTVKITVSASEGAGAARTEVVNGPEAPGFRDCMAGVMSDAQFEPPSHDVTMVWPVPIRTE